MNKQSVILWIVALFVTIGCAVFQRITGPTYPLRGTEVIGGREVVYRLNRSEEQRDALVRLAAAEGVTGMLQWKRHKSTDDWSVVPMVRHGEFLEASLPVQPPAGKLAYRVILGSGGDKVTLPPDEPAVIRFKGSVPPVVLWLHVVLIFGAMLCSTRAGLEAFRRAPRLKGVTVWTVALFLVSGVILGPIVQKYAFGAYWTGWPLGGDLTDNKTALALLGWILALVAVLKFKKPKPWVVGAAILLLTVYMIPHSLLGSELDYEKMPKPAGETVR